MVTSKSCIEIIFLFDFDFEKTRSILFDVTKTVFSEGLRGTKYIGILISLNDNESSLPPLLCIIVFPENDFSYKFIKYFLCLVDCSNNFIFLLSEKAPIPQSA
ncbi:hypothetical protein MWMV4_MWMV4_02050 [Acinetobacter baumannii]|nr:hypothetical protein MWMV4_MWMV4_02050 [Acinetobacter baumannii]